MLSGTRLLILLFWGRQEQETQGRIAASFATSVKALYAEGSASIRRVP